METKLFESTLEENYWERGVLPNVMKLQTLKQR